jgi:DNA-binding PadR family transcriptional regulator
MATFLENDDRVKLSPLDVRVLAALLRGEMGKYEISRQVETDMKSMHRVTNNVVYHSIRSLLIMACIREEETGEGKVKQVYHITDFGRSLLVGQVEEMERLATTVRERIAKKKF